MDILVNSRGYPTVQLVARLGSDLPDSNVDGIIDLCMEGREGRAVAPGMGQPSG